MASPYGIDLGNVLGKAEDITAARIKNRLANQQLKDTEALREERTNVLASSASPLAGMAAIDPTSAIEVGNFLSGLEDDEREILDRNINEIGQMAAWVLAGTEEEREDRYQQVRGSVSEDIRQNMPGTYDEKWVKLNLAKAQSIADILKDPGASSEILLDGAPSGWRWTDATKTKLTFTPGGPNDPAVKGEDGGAALEPSVSNAIRNATATQFDGIFNPTTGEFSVMDPTKAPTMLKVAARAEELVVAGENILNAVNKAMAELGGATATPAPGGTPAPANPTDPLGLGL